MSIRSSVVFLCSALAVALSPSFGYAAAQLKAGATTSAQPTSTNPQQRQIQITFDPGEDGYNVTRFQLSVMFDPNVVNIANFSDIQNVGPYNTPITSDFSLGAVPSEVSGPFNSSGLASAIGGSADVSQTQGGDVNIFSITFTLNDDVSLDQMMSFTMFAQSYGFFDEAAGSASPAIGPPDDFIQFTNPNDPSDQFYADPIAPITITGSFNSFSAQIAAAGAGGAATPLPAGAWAGAASLVLLGAWMKFHGGARLFA